MQQQSTYDSANAKCRELGAYLLTVESQAENNFVSELIKAEDQGM